MKNKSTPGDRAPSFEEIKLFDEDGALSREFLWRRGFCCQNACRNCPYGFCDQMNNAQYARISKAK